MQRRNGFVTGAIGLGCLLVFTSIAGVSAAPIIPGDLVVVKVGDGVTTISGNSAAAATSLLEFTTGGAPVQTIALPTSAGAGNNALTLSGSATSEGFLTQSTNGQFLTMLGYNAAPGTAGVATASPDVTGRVLGRISVSTGIVDSSTLFATGGGSLADAYNGSNPRSAVATDSSNVWMGGNGGSGFGATAGVRYVTSSTSSVRVDSTASNMRVVNIFGGQLYTSSNTGTLLGVSSVGTGLPTAASSAATVALPGMPTTGTHSPYDFWFKDANTLYIADDGAVASGGGIQKWILSGGTWTLVYTLLNNGTTTTSVRGLAGTVDGSGNAVLYATTTTGTANALITVTDTGASATATVLATAPALTAFRGVELIAAVPEPASTLTLGILALALGTRRRR